MHQHMLVKHLEELSPCALLRMSCNRTELWTKISVKVWCGNISCKNLPAFGTHFRLVATLMWFLDMLYNACTGRE